MKSVLNRMLNLLVIVALALPWSQLATGPVRAAGLPFPDAWTVTTTADSGPGSLRQALLDAANGDTVNFDPTVFPPTSPMTISLTSPLPDIFQGNLTLDASDAGVILDGSQIPYGYYRAFVLVSDGNVIRGFQIVNFPYDGILIANANDNIIGGDREVGSGPLGQGNLIAGNGGHGIQIHQDCTNNQILGNYIGTDVHGVSAWPNAYDGIALQGEPGPSNNVIGGSTASERNLISGNGQAGIKLSDASHDNIIHGNYIGTNAAGTIALPNLSQGVMLWSGAHHNLVGGTTPAERNVLSGNGHEGVLVFQPSTVHNIIQGNYIGTDASGSAAIGNQGGGIDLDSAGYTTIGGINTAPEAGCSGACNLISGNPGDNGITIFGTGAVSNTIQGNFIGVNLDGIVAIPNAGSGIWLGNDADHSLIGGSTAGERNLISGNNSRGITIQGPDSDWNVITGNYIGTTSGGNAPLGNRYQGISVDGGVGNRVGGPGEGERNVITYNDMGVQIRGSNTYSVTIQNNWIGVDADGTGALDPRHLVVTDDGTLFLANYGQGVFKSTDGAVTWQPATAGMTTTQVTLLAAAPNFATSQTAWACSDGVLFVTTDGGGQWSQVYNQFPGALKDLQASPDYQNDHALIAAIEEYGLYKSTDGGVNWRQVNTTLYVDNIAYSPNFGIDQTILAGASSSPEVLRSTDAGETWAASTTGLPGLSVYDLSFAADGQTVFLASHHCSNDGIYLSSDGGQTWAASGNGLDDCGYEWQVAVSPNFMSDDLVLAAEDQIFRSIDGGANWGWSGSGAFGSRAHALVFSPAFAADQTVYFASFAGVFKSTDQGQSWSWAGGNLADPGNGAAGIAVFDDAHPVQILGNVIAHNREEGIRISGGQAAGSLIDGNLVGLGPDGVTRAANGSTNIRLETPYVMVSNNTSSAGSHGGLRASTTAHHLTISNNRFGTDISGQVAVGNSYDGMTLESAWNTVHGNLISGNWGDGLYGSQTMTHTVVTGNLIGVNAAGVAAIPNQASGINLQASSDITIGGSHVGDRNIISGNATRNIGLHSSHDVWITGNFIGPDVNGSGTFPNNSAGVMIYFSQDCFVGGTAEGEGNLISGNNLVGLLIYSSSQITVSGNLAGTDVTGMYAIGNGWAGVAVASSQNVVVGGLNTSTEGGCAGACNLVSGNAGVGGVLLYNSNSTHNQISGNFIGTNIHNTGLLPNEGDGIRFINGATENIVGGNVDLTDGTCDGECNLIRGNLENGIRVGYLNGSITLSNTFTQNSIYENMFKGIELDDGGNHELPAPVVSVIQGDQVSGMACAGCTVEVFTDREDEGQFYEGHAVADAAGNWAAALPGITARNLTATATDLAGNTSEFSAPLTRALAEFSASPTTGVAPLGVSFTNLSSGSFDTCAWDFGDGGTSALCDNNQTYTYTVPGVYTVTLTVSGLGGTNTLVQASLITVSQGIEVPVSPVEGGTLVYTDTSGTEAAVEVPVGAVTETLTLRYAVDEGQVAVPTGFEFANVVFDLTAYLGEVALEGFVFQEAVTVTIVYTDTDVAGLDESQLLLYYWDGSAWVDAACGPYVRDPEANLLAVPICHLSQFAMFARESYAIYLPVIRRSP